MPIRFFILALFALNVSGLASARAEALTYRDLVSRLTDMEHLAVLPPPGEKTALASSYDRKSQYDAVNDKYLNWDANDDGHGIIREEGDEVVLADIQGTGCIWRLWSAAPDNGHLKIYLDGSSTPVVDMPCHDYFDDSKEPFNYPNLVNMRAGVGVPGSLNYVPIPFAKSCKIVGDKTKPGQPGSGWGQYFQATYTLFAPGTTVPTFKLPLSDDDKAALQDASARISKAGTNVFPPHAGEKTETTKLTLKPDSVSPILGLEGPQAITALKVKLDLPKDAEAQRKLLRQLTISIKWDGEDKPSVWAPLGDFFAAVGGSGPFAALPVGLGEDGTFYAYWYMPFAKGAKIELGNDGDSDVPISLEITHAPLDLPIEKLARFHAKWHRDAFNPTRPDRKPDWTMVTTQGAGRFVGVLLHVWFPNGGWWGEGDDKFFVDGEKFPSSFGTGSEDCFGYAWSSGNRFVRAQYGQPLAEGNMGHEVDYRWHISDQVPFQTSFDGDIEKYNPNETDSPYGGYAIYAATAFWYLAAGGVDNYEPKPIDQRIGYWKRPPISYTEPGVIEGESLQPVTPPLYEHYVGSWYLPGGMIKTWSNDRILAWTTDHPPDPVNGEHMELKVPIEKAGKFQIMARFVKAENGGIYQLSLDGKKIGDPLDLYNKEKKIIPVDLMSLGTFDLTAGEHILGVMAVGKNPELGDRRDQFFGMDYLKLVPAP
jgi:hypothetical protein